MSEPRVSRVASARCRVRNRVTDIKVEVLNLHRTPATQCVFYAAAPHRTVQVALTICPRVQRAATTNWVPVGKTDVRMDPAPTRLSVNQQTVSGQKSQPTGDGCVALYIDAGDAIGRQADADIVWELPRTRDTRQSKIGLDTCYDPLKLHVVANLQTGKRTVGVTGAKVAAARPLLVVEVAQSIGARPTVAEMGTDVEPGP